MPGVEIFERGDYDSIEELIRNKTPIIFKSAIEFSEFIETTAIMQSMTNTQVVLDYCEIYDMEYESLAQMMTQNLKDKIATEMRDAGLLPKTSQLEFE